MLTAGFTGQRTLHNGKGTQQAKKKIKGENKRDATFLQPTFL